MSGLEHRDKRVCIARTANSDDACANLETQASARSKLSNQVEEGFKRRNKEFIKSTFESHQDPATGSMLTSSLESALLSLGIRLHTAELSEILRSRGLSDGEGLDFQDFTSLVSIPSPIEEWVRALPLSQLVADAMPKNDSCRGTDQLRHLSRMTQQQLDISCDVIMEHLVKIFQDQLVILKEAYAKIDSHVAADSTENSEKFQICKMNVGNLVNFHEGLASRIGILYS
jgi:hypothetical protein